MGGVCETDMISMFMVCVSVFVSRLKRARLVQLIDFTPTPIHLGFPSYFVSLQPLAHEMTALEALSSHYASE